MPSIHIVLVVLGAVLVLSGIVGGGLSLKEIKLPKLNKLSRILACIFGVIFIVAGIYLEKIPDKKNNQNPIIYDSTSTDDLEEQKKEKERLAQIEEQKKEQERLDKLERERKEQERLAEIERQKKEQERKKAEYTRRALDTPKNHAWHGELLIYDSDTKDTLANGSIIFGQTINKKKITYAQINFDKSTITGFTGKAKATSAGWGFMGANMNSSISMVFANNVSNLWIHFDVLKKDYNNGYWELHGLLLKGNKMIGRVRTSCRAK